MPRQLTKQSFAVLIGMGIAGAQSTTQIPPDQVRQIERDKEAIRTAALSEPVKLIGSPTLVRAHPIPILWPPLVKIENVTRPK